MNDQPAIRSSTPSDDDHSHHQNNRSSPKFDSQTGRLSPTLASSHRYKAMTTAIQTFYPFLEDQELLHALCNYADKESALLNAAQSTEKTNPYEYTASLESARLDREAAVFRLNKMSNAAFSTLNLTLLREAMKRFKVTEDLPSNDEQAEIVQETIRRSILLDQIPSRPDWLQIVLALPDVNPAQDLELNLALEGLTEDVPDSKGHLYTFRQGGVILTDEPESHELVHGNGVFGSGNIWRDIFKLSSKDLSDLRTSVGSASVEANADGADADVLDTGSQLLRVRVEGDDD